MKSGHPVTQNNKKIVDPEKGWFDPKIGRRRRGVE